MVSVSATNPPATGQVAVPCALGWVVATLGDDAVTAVDIVADRPVLTPAQTPLAGQVATALDDYFTTARWPEELPLAPSGTPFQHRVWDCLRQISTGHTRSYGDIARELGSSARAVGGACRANPLLLLIPCHRVVARHGQGGFAGQTAGRWPAIKAWLLAHEG